MAKSLSAPKMPSKDDQLRWKAEDIVRESLVNSPAYKAAVRETMKQLRTVQKDAAARLKKGK